MKFYVKHMVSFRCILKVKEALNRLNIPYRSVEFAEVELDETITPEQRDQLKLALTEVGLELAEDGRSILVEKIKRIIIEMVHYTHEHPKQNFSQYLKERLNYDYTYLSNVFSSSTGVTIEHYIIYHKIERVKELIQYNELSLSQIAYKLHYSSIAHLSSQFKKITGYTPTFFKHLHTKNSTQLQEFQQVGIV